MQIFCAFKLCLHFLMSLIKPLRGVANDVPQLPQTSSKSFDQYRLIVYFMVVVAPH